MEILNQLRDEAKQKKTNQAQQHNQEKQLEQVYHTKLLPKMQQIFVYFKEVVEHLNFIESRIGIEEYNHRFPQFGLLNQGNYKINTDGYGGYADFERLLQINITFFLTGEGAFTYQVIGSSKIEQEISFLHTKNIHFCWQHLTSKEHNRLAAFTINRKVPVRFRFEVDFENTIIKLIINNHEELTTYQKIFLAEEINEELLEQVSRYMLRKDTDAILLNMLNQQ
jgi:hypothetical protein